jgi:hypothetical protein
MLALLYLYVFNYNNFTSYYRHGTMNRQSQGHYKTSSTLGEAVRAYVPAPLPPVPPID